MPSQSSHSGQKNIQLQVVILVFIGFYLTFRRESSFLRLHSKESWGAVLIALALYKLFSAVRVYRISANTKGVWEPALRGVVLGLVGCVLFFNLEWSYIWPSFLILGGLSRFLRGARGV